MAVAGNFHSLVSNYFKKDVEKCHSAWGHGKSEKNANLELRAAMEGGLGSFLHHFEIRSDHPELYRSDGVHLSAIRMDIFLKDLQQGLQRVLGVSVGGKA